MSVELLEKVTLAFDNTDIEYLVIGGQAVLVHGRARFTNDIDIIIKADINDIQKVKTICEDLQLVFLTENIEDFVRTSMVMPVYDSEAGFRVDIIFAFTDFELNAIRRAKKIKVKNRHVNFASLEDLVVFKMFAGRELDYSDVKDLLLMNRDYDKAYITEWLNRFDAEPGKKLTAKFLEITASL